MALEGLPMVGPGEDLPALIVNGLARSSFELLANDIVVITGKVVSKAEDRIVALDSVRPSARRWGWRRSRERIRG
jgi:coenzyme F420-0:L-glutamate ligase/coenzyme F420-1:gamma-L-glutamate ligase